MKESTKYIDLWPNPWTAFWTFPIIESLWPLAISTLSLILEEPYALDRMNKALPWHPTFLPFDRSFQTKIVSLVEAPDHSRYVEGPLFLHIWEWDIALWDCCRFECCCWECWEEWCRLGIPSSNDAGNHNAGSTNRNPVFKWPLFTWRADANAAGYNDRE